MVLLGAAVEQHDDQQAQQCEGEVAVDAPGQGRMVGEPLVLGHHAEDHTGSRQSVDGPGHGLLALDVVALTPDVVQQHIEYRHGDRGDPLAQTQLESVAVKAGGAQSQCAGHQMEGITGTQHHSHPAKQLELGGAFTVPDHADAHGKDGEQIKNVKKRFKDRTHRKSLLCCLKWVECGNAAGSCLRERNLTSLIEQCSL